MFEDWHEWKNDQGLVTLNRVQEPPELGKIITWLGRPVHVPGDFDQVLFDQEHCVRVLDDGFVRVVDQMGDQDAVVQAARVSYGAGTRTVRDDQKLIRYLYEHKHTTPFEMVELKFQVRVPMDCWRQWIRHRTASVNEYSTRYSVAIDSMATAQSRWRLQSGKNRQGSEGVITDQEVIFQLDAEEAELHALAKRVYETRLEFGVAREQARKDLCLSTYTEAYWKIDLHNLLHFLRLRLDAAAQEEIRKYAEAIVSLLKPRLPLIMELLIGS